MNALEPGDFATRNVAFGISAFAAINAVFLAFADPWVTPSGSGFADFHRHDLRNLGCVAPDAPQKTGIYTPPGPSAPIQASNALWAARLGGVKHVVRMSAVGAAHDAPSSRAPTRPRSASAEHTGPARHHSACRRVGSCPYHWGSQPRRRASCAAAAGSGSGESEALQSS